MNRNLAIFALCASLVPGVAAAQGTIPELEAQLKAKPNDIGILVNLGRAYHTIAADGDREAVEKAFSCFDKVLAAEPANAFALASRGSLWTLRGRDASEPMEKVSDVDRGIDEMDKAVSLAPDNVGVRLVRGINSLRLPSMFKRDPIAMKDFGVLLASPALPHLDPGLQATIFYWAGVAHQRDGQSAKAKGLFEKCAAAAPGSPIAAMAQEQLNQLH